MRRYQDEIGNQIVWFKGYIDAKIEGFANTHALSTEFVSERLAELLRPAGRGSEDSVQDVRSYTPRVHKKLGRTVEVGRHAPDSPAPAFQPKADQPGETTRREGGKAQPARSKWKMTEAQKKTISEARKRYWANLTEDQKRKLNEKIQRAKRKNAKARAA